MFLIIPTEDVAVKPYWAADSIAAEKVKHDLQKRFQVNCQILEYPTYKHWDSKEKQQVSFDVAPDVHVSCSVAKLKEALFHAKNNFITINPDTENIFCFYLNDTFWQQSSSLCK